MKAKKIFAAFVGFMILHSLFDWLAKAEPSGNDAEKLYEYYFIISLVVVSIWYLLKRLDSKDKAERELEIEAD